MLFFIDSRCFSVPLSARSTKNETFSCLWEHRNGKTLPVGKQTRHKEKKEKAKSTINFRPHLPFFFVFSIALQSTLLTPLFFPFFFFFPPLPSDFQQALPAAAAALASTTGGTADGSGKSGSRFGFAGAAAAAAAGAAAAVVAPLAVAIAEEEADHGLHPPRFPWSHEGLFSSYDHAAIRRGHQVYTQVGNEGRKKKKKNMNSN